MCHVQKQSVDAAPVASQGLAHVLCATTLHRAGFTKRAPVKLCPVEDSGRLSLRKCSSPQASLGGQPSIGTHLTAEPASRGLVLASVPPPACTPRLCQHAAEDRSRLTQDPTCVTDTITCQPASLVLSCPSTTGNLKHHGNARIALREFRDSFPATGTMQNPGTQARRRPRPQNSVSTLVLLLVGETTNHRRSRAWSHNTSSCTPPRRSLS